MYLNWLIYRYTVFVEIIIAYIILVNVDTDLSTVFDQGLKTKVIICCEIVGFSFYNICAHLCFNSRVDICVLLESD